MNDYYLRPLRTDDMEAVMELSATEGWNQTAQDWKFLLEDPRNICVAAVSGDKVIGTTVALDYGRQLAWIGMVLVNKAYRGKGVSRLLLQYVFESCKAAMKLDATALGEPVYRKFGFLPEYTIARMVNTSVATISNDHNDLPRQALSKHFASIVSLDKMALGIKREKLIAYYMQQYPGKARVLEENDRVEGFALRRDGYRYHHIGPIVAATTAQAALLLRHALAQLPGQPVVVDVPVDKKEMIQMLLELNFVEQRQFIRMYRDENTFAGNISKLFAIAGPEFG
jgi:GNAT superfamily N-acetyltransferase